MVPHGVRSAQAVFLGSLLLSGTALAQGGVSSSIDEIVVTVQKRAQSLQDVPIAISAFQSGDLDAFDFTDASDIAAQVPNLQVSGAYNQSKPIFALRGISFKSFNATDSQAVGIYNDEVYIASRSGQLFQMFDLERVEVLRGPQGILYGRNTTGGAINFVSRKPSDDLEANAALTLGRFNQFDVEAAVTVPIVQERLSARVAAVTNNRDGNTLNEFTGNKVNSRDDWAARALIRFLPTENQEWLLNIHGGVSRGDGSYYHSRGIVPTGDGRFSDFFGYVENPHWWTLSSDLSEAFEDIENFGATLTGTIDFDTFSLTSVTAYDKTDYVTHEDSDASPNDLVDVIFGDETEQFSQELRAASRGEGVLQWLIGLYYFTDNLKGDNTFNFGVIDPSAFSHQVYDQDSKNFAVFGQVSYDLTSALTAHVGGRWTYEKKKMAFVTTDLFVYTLGPTPEVTTDASTSESWNEFTWKIGLDYRINDDVLTYASYNRGFKSGGYNGIVFIQDEFSVVDPEFVNAFEIGLKSNWWDRRLVLNLAAFYNDFSDLHIFNFTEGPGGIPVTQIVNAASARAYGLEAEAVLQPVEGLRIQAGLGLLNTKIKRVDVAELAGLTGNDLALSPKLNFNGVVEYDIAMGNDAGWLTPRLEATYTGSQYFDPSNDPLARQSNYWLLNAALSYRDGADRYSITLWARNITNEKYLTESLPFTDFGLYEQKHGERATYGVTLRYHLN